MSEMFHDHEDTAVKRKETEAQRQKRIVTAVSAVLASADGRAVLAAIIGLCQPESMNCQDGAAAFRIEGARNVGIQINTLLRSSDPAGYMKLYQEIYLP